MGVGRAGGEQDVAAAEVAVHDPARMQECHAARNLRRRRQQRRPVGLPIRRTPAHGLNMRGPQVSNVARLGGPSGAWPNMDTGMRARKSAATHHEAVMPARVQRATGYRCHESAVSPGWAARAVPAQARVRGQSLQTLGGQHTDAVGGTTLEDNRHTTQHEEQVLHVLQANT